jgi:hypothetical protein
MQAENRRSHCLTIPRSAQESETASPPPRPRRRTRGSLFEEAPFRILSRQSQCPQVGRTGIVDSSQPAIEVGSRWVREMVAAQIAALEHRVDERQSGGRSMVHGDCRRAVQLDDRRRVEFEQDIIDRDDSPR